MVPLAVQEARWSRMCCPRERGSPPASVQSGEMVFSGSHGREVKAVFWDVLEFVGSILTLGQSFLCPRVPLSQAHPSCAPGHLCMRLQGSINS